MSSNADSPSSQNAKPQRILACVLCQQRKIKCDRKFPCSHCVKTQTTCVPGSLVQRRRRRRFPERELLERLRKYEDLLRHNKVAFEPLHKTAAGQNESLREGSGDDSDDGHTQSVEPGSSTASRTLQSDRRPEAKNVWHTMSSGFRDPDADSNSSYDEVRENAVKAALEMSAKKDDHLLFCSFGTNDDLSVLHPDPVEIFRLWQIYLDNVNPLLKVTHTPTLQGRIIEAASNVTKIGSTLEALMFSIYCMAMQSLSAEDCQALFGSPKDYLLMRYQFGCQQALCNCGFLRSDDRDCLTALYLYLVSVRPSTSPQSLSSMLGVAIRIARRMGIHKESNLVKHAAAEAEMCRRLWWSLALFDHRIGELAVSQTGILDPTWDCKIPLNVNDFDLRPEMKEAPTIQDKSTDALFAVVRGELGDFVRHAAFHLDYISPAFKGGKNFPDSSIAESEELLRLEKRIEDQYLKFCNQENPMHFMTVWTARAYVSKCRLIEHGSQQSGSSVRPAETQRDVATALALRMLECDTKVMISPLTKGFLWYNRLNFPFPAYIQIVQDLRRRPISEHAQRAWEVMDENYQAWFGSQNTDDSPFFKVFAKIILQAWEACEAASRQAGSTVTPPKMVSSIHNTLASLARQSGDTSTEGLGQMGSLGLDEVSAPVPDATGQSVRCDDMVVQDGGTLSGPDAYSSVLAQSPEDINMNHSDWALLGGLPGWGGY